MNEESRSLVGMFIFTFGGCWVKSICVERELVLFYIVRKDFLTKMWGGLSCISERAQIEKVNGKIDEWLLCREEPFAF